MAKSQLKQNQLYLTKLKIVKVVTNLEIIQPQFLIGQHFLVFDKRKLKKKSKIGNPFPLKRENDVSTLPPPSNVKMTFQGTNRFLILTMW